MDEFISIGEKLLAHGQLSEAEELFSGFLALHPGHAPAIRSLAQCLILQNKLSRALSLLQEFLADNPGDLLGHLLMGRLCLRLDQTASAQLHGEKILQVLPHSESARSLLSDVALASGQAERALRLAQDMLGHNSRSKLGLHAKASALEALGRIDEAHGCWSSCAEQWPQDASALYHLGRSLLKLGHLDPGWAHLALAPQAGARPRLPLKTPEWTGEPVDRLLLVANQGLGDAIQFARYLPWARARCAHLTLACKPELASWLSQAWGVSCVLLSEMGALPHDAHLPLMGVARFLAGAKDPYHVQALCLASATTEPQPGPRPLRLGISLECSRLHSTEQFPHTRRSCPASQATALAQIDGAQFFNLQTQPDPQAQELFGTRWHEVGHDLGSIGDTFAWVQKMDAIISVDSVLIHVAGTLGKPSWLALPSCADWRWQTHPRRNPWYPSVTLSRQKTPGQWAPVFEDIAALVGQGALPSQA